MRRVILAAAFLMLITGASVAQLPEKEIRLGSRIPQKIDYQRKSIAEVRTVSAIFADCAVKRRHDDVRRLLLEHAGQEDEDTERKRLFMKVADGDCLVKATSAFSSVQMRFPGDTLRYALAEALVRADLLGRPVLVTEGILRLMHPTFKESDFTLKPGQKRNEATLAKLAEYRSKRLTAVFLSQFGECVVRSQPSMALDLLRTAPSSPDESKSLAALNPWLGACVGSDESFKLDKSNVRGTIALNYYRLANAPRLSVQGK